MQVFLSYGHDEHAPLVRRIQRDLEAHGHTVWIDVERILPTQDWGEAIERGIDASDVVVAFITPHAMRRPGGVCLQELSHAGSLGKPIRTVLLQLVPLPLTISCIQYLDMQGWKDPQTGEIREDWYRGKLATLLDAVSGKLALGLEGEQAFLRGWLEPFDNGFEIDRHVRGFVGREEVFERYRAWLERREAPRVLWITGGAGTGKSGLAAMLAFREPSVVGVHFCHAGDGERGDAGRALRSLAFQLTTQWSDYGRWLLALPERTKDRLASSGAASLLRDLFLAPLGALPDPGRRLVLLVDALDEGGPSIGELAALLGEEADRLPEWLRFVVTGRPENELVERLGRAERLAVDADAAESAEAVRRLAAAGLRGRLTGAAFEDAVRTLVDRSAGNFLYAREVLSDVERGRLSTVDAFPAGLAGVYRSFFERRFPNVDAYRAGARPLLEILLATTGRSVSREFAGRVLGWDDYVGDEVLSALGTLFPARGGTLRAFHASVLDWLKDPERSGPYRVSEVSGHERLAEAFAAWRAEGQSTCAGVLVDDGLAGALVATGRWDAARALFADSERPLSPEAYRLVRLFPSGFDVSFVRDALLGLVEVAKSHRSRGDADDALLWFVWAFRSLERLEDDRLAWFFDLVRSDPALPSWFAHPHSESGSKAFRKDLVIDSCGEVRRRLEESGADLPEDVRRWADALASTAGESV